MARPRDRRMLLVSNEEDTMLTDPTYSLSHHRQLLGRADRRRRGTPVRRSRLRAGTRWLTVGGARLRQLVTFGREQVSPASN